MAIVTYGPENKTSDENIYILFVLYLFVISCKNDHCAYTDYLTSSWAGINLQAKDAQTGEYLIKSQGSKFLKSEIQVTSPDNTDFRWEFVENRNNQGSNEYFYSLRLENFIDEEKVNKDLCKRIFIDFKSDRDTLDYCYKIKPGDCDITEFEYFNIKYNGKVIKSDNPDAFIFEGTILK